MASRTRLWRGVGIVVVLAALVAVILVLTWPSVRGSLAGVADGGARSLQKSSADIAAIAGVLSLLALGWVGLIMTSLARRFYRDGDDHFSAGQSRSEALSNQSLYRLVLSLHDEIADLRRQVEALGASTDAMATRPASTAGVRDENGRGPGDLPSDFYDTGAPLKARTVRTQRVEQPSTAPSAATPSPPPVRRGADRSADIRRLSSSSAWNELIETYQRVLSGEIGPDAFERSYSPQTYGLDANDGLRPVADGNEAYFWLVAAAEDKSLAVLFPAKRPIQQWAELFQFGAGTRARKIFGPAFRVDPGDDLALIEPAWVAIFPGGVEVARMGHIRGA